MDPRMDSGMKRDGDDKFDQFDPSRALSSAETVAILQRLYAAEVRLPQTIKRCR
jgi:hypothetical protein